MIYLPDTNILIGVITGRRPYAEMLTRLVEDHHVLATCSIIVSEIYAGMRAEEEPRTAALLESLEFLACDHAIAKRAGRIRYEAMSKGIHRSLGDTTIAAIAIAHRCTLITENSKDFDVPDLRVQTP